MRSQGLSGFKGGFSHRYSGGCCGQTTLQGGIYDSTNPRDPVRNAELHVGRKILIKEDIKSFFPSTSSDLVVSVWHSLFGFSHEVSRCLTALTTLNGQLPQGAKTSTFLANLVLWKNEPDLVAYLRSNGLQYSRYIDGHNNLVHDRTFWEADSADPQRRLVHVQELWVPSEFQETLHPKKFTPNGGDRCGSKHANCGLKGKAFGGASNCPRV